MLALSTLVLAILAQEPAPDATQAGPDVSGIQAAVQALTAAENYTFVQTTLDGGTPMGGAAGRGGDAAPPTPEPVSLTGHVQKGQPVHFLQGEEQAWRDSEGNVAFLAADGTWKALDPAAMRGAFGGRGGRGGGGGGQDAQDPAAREAQRAQQQAMRARMGLMRAPIAHEVFVGLEKGVETVRKSEKGGKAVYSGTLSAEGAAAMGGGGMASRGGRGGRGGPGGNAMETSGAFTVVVGASGVVESVVVETVTKGSFGDRTFERTRRMEMQIQKVGETTLEIPAEAIEALKAAASTRSARERGNEEF